MEEKRDKVRKALKILSRLEGLDSLGEIDADDILDEQEAESDRPEQIDLFENYKPKALFVYPAILGTVNPFYVASRRDNWQLKPGLK